MPLIEKDTYTWNEAVERVKSACPDDDPIQEIWTALSIPYPNNKLVAYVVSEIDGRRWKIDPAAFSSKQDFQLNRETGFVERYKVRGLVQRLILRGELLIRRKELDELCMAVRSDDSAQLASENAAKPRSQHKRKTETKKRNNEVQAAAEKKWEEDPDLSKEDVAKLMLKDESLGDLLTDHRKTLGDKLSEDTLVRMISKPDWLKTGKR